MRKDKQKVLDEVWDDARVQSFLAKSTPIQSGAALPGDPDFFVLRHAYQSMRPGDFERFLERFTAEGRNVGARDGKGRTLSDVIVSHAKAGPFIELLARSGSPDPATASVATSND